MCTVQCTVIKFSGEQSVMGGVKCPTPVFVIATRVLSPLCALRSHCNSGHNALIITLSTTLYFTPNPALPGVMILHQGFINCICSVARLKEASKAKRG